MFIKNVKDQSVFSYLLLGAFRIVWCFVFAELRLALIQLSVGVKKADNLSRALKKVKDAAGNGAQLVALPECFNSPYGTGTSLYSVVFLF